MRLDGARVTSVAEIAAGGKVRRIDGLFDALERRKAAAPAQRAARLEFDPDVPAVVVESVFMTTTLAGFPDVAFATAPAASRSVR